MIFVIYVLFLFGTFSNSFLSISTPIGEMSILRICILLLTLLYALTHWNKKDINPFVNQKFSSFWLFLLLYSVVQLMWVKDFAEWFKSFYIFFEVFLLYTILPKTIKTKKQVLICLFLFQLSILVQMAIGFREALTGNYFVQTKYVDSYLRLQSISNSSFYTPVAMMYNPNDFATLLIVGTCISLIMFFLTKHIVFKVYNILYVMCCGVLIFFADSRACLIGYALVFVLYVFLYFKNRFLKSSLIISILIIGIVLLPKLQSFFFDVNMSESDDIRLSLIFDGFYILLLTAGLGTGFGQVSWWYSNKHNFSGGVVLIPHNFWIEILMTFGVVFFIAFIYLYFKQIKRLNTIRTTFKKKDERTLAAGFEIFLLVFIIVGISSSSLLKTEYMWAFLALASSFASLKHQKCIITKEARYESLCVNM